MPRRRGRVVVATRCRGVHGSTRSRIFWGATPVVSGIARTAHTNQPTMHNVTIAIGEAPDYSASRRNGCAGRRLDVLRSSIEVVDDHGACIGRSREPRTALVWSSFARAHGDHTRRSQMTTSSQHVAVVHRLLLRVGDGLGVGELDGDADGVTVDVGCAEVVSELP